MAKEKRISPMWASIKKLEEQIAEIKTQIGEIINKESVAEIIEPELKSDDRPSYSEPPKVGSVPIPLEYSRYVIENLGEDFGIELVPSIEKPEFMFTIIVPKRFKTVEEGQTDRRSKVISYALGLAGVKEWVDKVKANISVFQNAQLK